MATQLLAGKALRCSVGASGRRATAAAATAPHSPSCNCCAGASAGRVPFALPGGPRAAALRSRLVAARAAVAEAPSPPAPTWSTLNMKGDAVTPPSAGTPTWQAIIEVGGAQQIVSEGRFYSCHSLPGVEAGQRVVFERVLATKGAGEAPQLRFGAPYVPGARVFATVLENYKDKKIVVFKMKAKKHYRRKMGHRQQMSRFLVTKVELGN